MTLWASRGGKGREGKVISSVVGGEPKVLNTNCVAFIIYMDLKGAGWKVMQLLYRQGDADI